MFEDLFDDLIEEKDTPNTTQKESCEGYKNPDDIADAGEVHDKEDYENPWEKVWKSARKAWYTDDEDDEEDKIWNITGCVFSGSPPDGYNAWSEWIDKIDRKR